MVTGRRTPGQSRTLGLGVPRPSAAGRERATEAVLAGARWNDFGSIWKTIREVDVTAIRREAEHDVVLACVGDREALTQARELLLDGPDLYPSPFAAVGFVPLDQVHERERLIG